MPTPVSIAQWDSWRSDEYFREYYSQGVPPDEQAAIQFQVSFLRRAGREFPRAVEYGCGPTLQRAVAASPYVASLDMADRLDGNLDQVRRWAAGDPRADDWGRFTEYVLRCEGEVEPSRGAVLAREARTRLVLSELLPTDANNRHPLGAERFAYYDLLISGFCLDCFAQSKTVWQQCMSNVFGQKRGRGEKKPDTILRIVNETLRRAAPVRERVRAWPAGRKPRPPCSACDPEKVGPWSSCCCTPSSTV